MCQPGERKSGARPPHQLEAPHDDVDLIQVYDWLKARPTTELLRDAVDSAVKYVLDGARTWRFDLNNPAVDSDERSSVGTKLQYHIIQALKLVKQPPLDTMIEGLAVEIKGTVRNTWMIPREGQCEITLLIRIDTRRHAFAAWLMRTHRAWLTGKKGNRDLKRSPRADAFRQYSLEVVPWTSLPPEPLRLLSQTQLLEVFDQGAGLRMRLMALFRALPEIVIPRSSITVVGAGLHDPMKRAREAKSALRGEGLIVLVGTWVDERQAAAELGFDLADEAWVAVPVERFTREGVVIPPPR
jgi:hypothetical protein